MMEKLDKFYNAAVAESERIIDLSAKMFVAAIIGAILVAISFKIINLITKKYVVGIFESKRSKPFKKWGVYIINKGLKTLVLLIYLNYLGVPISSILVVFGIFIGLILIGLQNTISNLGSGVWIMVTKPFDINSEVKFKEIEGTVTEISLYQIKVLTWDKKVVNIPNSLATSDYIVNYNANKTRRVDIDIPVSYHNDLDEVQKILLNAIKEYKDYEILDDPEPEVIVKTFEQRLAVLQARVHVKTIDVWVVGHYLPFALNRALRENDIKFGYYQKTFDDIPNSKDISN